MTSGISHRRLRNVVVTVLLAAGLTVPIAVAQPATADAPEPSVAPSGVYPSIDSCTLTATPKSIGKSDTFTVTATFTPANARYRIGADGLGPAWASVLVEASSPYVLTGPASTIESTIGLASGWHSMDLYAVDADGYAVGQPLCSATYEYDGPVEAPIGQPLVELPRAMTGVPYESGVITGSTDPSNWWVYRPTTTAGSRVVTSCDVSLVSSTPVFGPIYEVEGGSGGRGGDAGFLRVPSLPNYFPIVGGTDSGFHISLLNTEDEAADHLVFTNGVPADNCGSISGRLTTPGTYTLRQTVLWKSIPSVAAPDSVPSTLPSDVASQTYASQRTLILVVDLAPPFTG